MRPPQIKWGDEISANPLANPDIYVWFNLYQTRKKMSIVGKIDFGDLPCMQRWSASIHRCVSLSHDTMVLDLS
jgi:hypothetical protein